MLFKIIVVSLLYLIVKKLYRIRFIKAYDGYYLVYFRHFTHDGLEWYSDTQRILIKKIYDEGGEKPF